MILNVVHTFLNALSGSAIFIFFVLTCGQGEGQLSGFWKVISDWSNLEKGMSGSDKQAFVGWERVTPLKTTAGGGYAFYSMCPIVTTVNLAPFTGCNESERSFNLQLSHRLNGIHILKHQMKPFPRFFGSLGKLVVWQTSRKTFAQVFVSLLVN